MALRKYVPPGDTPSTSMKPLRFVTRGHGSAVSADPQTRQRAKPVDIDLKEVYFLIMHFLSAGPCQRTFGQLWNELLEHQLLPRRYHAWYSRSGERSGDDNDDGISYPLGYSKLVERYPHVEKDHLVKLLKQLLSTAPPSQDIDCGRVPTAADVPTLLGSGSFSLLNDKGSYTIKRPSPHMRWPHKQADQVRGLGLREIGGGFTRHHRSPSIRAASYAIAKPATMVQKMQNIKRIRGHRNAVYCAAFDRSGRHVITGSDDRLVKIWSTETAYCLASCRGHEGDITDLAVSSNNALVASSSNDCVIRVWRLPDGLPISVLRGHTAAVTAIAFSPRPSALYQLLSSSDDGTCRIWDARNSQISPRVFLPRPDPAAGRNGSTSIAPSAGSQNHQIFCCAFNANGTVFVTGGSDTLARVYNAFKLNKDETDQPNHEIDILAGHENDVNYVQFSGCALTSRVSVADTSKEEVALKFKNSWFSHDNIVTCSRDGSAIIWIPKSRRSHSKVGRWTRAYHLKVPPPPMPPQPPKGGPRQRVLPTPRGVNMIVWSLDNRFVLAAIMDCRICVWNASDGSLVHSLTGHTDSTYVLDVHPLDPRIAMSAGYDGKIIVWDIWEGKPMRIYEISHFKLVDGRFSPDGTSLVLSDDVGQLYLLSTGEGESQRDAKYDQFFLGDYRPLIQDTSGNVLDQETQLAPYRRNMQDLLCDSGMTPYEEPYQSMYQKRRLGALGIEWRPSSLRLAIGPDFSVDQDFAVLPLPDLDAFVEPLPEFLNAMDWEPEVEIISDDNDSEYIVAEENSSGGEKGSHGDSSEDLECSDGSDAEDSNPDQARRSRRRKQKAEAEVMTSSGRRVKRRNIDEYGGDVSRNSGRVRKQRHGQKKRSSKSKSSSSRPRRKAARNALSLFSRIKGASTDGEEEEEEYGSEDDISESESTRPESISESDESEQSLQDDQIKNLKGKGVARVEDEDEVDYQHHNEHVHPADEGKRKRLILKFPINKITPPVILEDKPQKPTKLVIRQANGDDTEQTSSQLKGECSMSLSEGYANGKIKWGGVRARSSKRPRLAETVKLDPGSCSRSNGDGGLENQVNGFVETVPENEEPSKHEVSTSKEVTHNGLGECNGELKDEVCVSNHGLDEVTESKPLSEITLDRGALTDASKLEFAASSVDNDDTRNDHHCQISEIAGSSTGKIDTLDNGHDALSVPGNNVAAAGPTVQNSSNVEANGNKTYAVYRRSKLTKPKTNVAVVEGSVVARMEESTSNPNNNNNNNNSHMIASRSNSREIDEDKTPNTESAALMQSREKEESSSLQPSEEDGSPPSRDKVRGEEWGGSTSKATVGLRSTRNRRSSFHLRDSSPPVDRRKSSQSSRKASWLLLTSHGEGTRYIPQRGDSVVYLRQGHEEYISQCGSRESVPWKQMKSIQAVEFCEVEGLEYSIWAGSGECCCKMTLKFSDPCSSVNGKTFKLTLPELVGLPDFLVERSRFESAMQRNWTTRDKCRVWWWKNNDEEDGDWWHGRILSAKPKSKDFPDSPWERFSVQYKSDPPETYLHSPWELFDAETQQDTEWEQPCIDDDSRNKLLAAISKLEQSGNKAQDRYGIQKLKQVSQKNSFLNRFPVPVTLDVIQSRLENNYYRSLEAVKHDVSVMLSNAESHFGKNQELSTKIRRLSDWFTRTLSSL